MARKRELMIKDKKIDFKLVNIAVLAFIVYLMYHTGNLWIGLFHKFISILMPFIIGFGCAYSVYPIVSKLQQKGLPKGFSILIVVTFLISLIIFIGYIISTTCVSQISAFFESINVFIERLSHFNIKGLQDSINKNFELILDRLTKYVSNGAINLVSSSIDFIGDLFIGIAAFIYFLIDMDKIRKSIKNYLLRKNKRTFRFLRLLDEELKDYLGGLVQIMIISIFEYGIVYLIIGHPNAIVLGILAGIANLIPYFGGIINNLIASITAFIISPSLFVKTLVVFFLLSIFDSYVINPHVYGKTNQIHPLITIFALFAGGALFGVMGVFISFPLAIFFVSLIKFYKNDISDGIEKIKESTRKETTV